jgi:hypothetical protein
MPKTLEEAAVAVDDMFNQAFENAGRETFPYYVSDLTLMQLHTVAGGDDSGEESGDEDGRREAEEEEDGPIGQESDVSPGIFLWSYRIHQIVVVRRKSVPRRLTQLLSALHRRIWALLKRQRQNSQRSWPKWLLIHQQNREKWTRKPPLLCGIQPFFHLGHERNVRMTAQMKAALMVKTVSMQSPM